MAVRAVPVVLAAARALGRAVRRGRTVRADAGPGKMGLELNMFATSKPTGTLKDVRSDTKGTPPMIRPDSETVVQIDFDRYDDKPKLHGVRAQLE
jgi:hypothetical protein